MAGIFEEMSAFFAQDDWKTTKVPDKPVLRMSFAGDDGAWICFAQARESQQQMVFYSVAPLKVPEDRRAVMAEFLHRANYGMIIGNFEIDFSDGEVRYKTSIDVEGGTLFFPLIKAVVYQNVLTMDRYLKGVTAVALGQVDAVAGIQMVEG
jgi:hypothetical protein